MCINKQTDVVRRKSHIPASKKAKQKDREAIFLFRNVRFLLLMLLVGNGGNDFNVK